MIYNTREAIINDASQIAKIYNEGIEDRIATLETNLRNEENIEGWFKGSSGKHKILVIENEDGLVVGWASLNVFNSRCCYSGVADISVYIKRDMRGKGLGKLLLKYLIETAKKQEFRKLVLSTFDFNEAGKRLYKSIGFREVGTYMNQGVLDGKFVNVTIMEMLLV